LGFFLKFIGDIIMIRSQYIDLKRKISDLADQHANETTHPLMGHFSANRFAMIAGPCAVETPKQIDIIARHVTQHKSNFIRGGAFKPRTNPYSFQGLGFEGITLLHEAGQAFNCPVVSEIMDVELIERLKDKVDIFQIGSRNMQNYTLLKALGKIDNPVILKRAMHATLEEFVFAAEYIRMHGNPNVILCERGIRTFEDTYRNTLDLNAVATLKNLTNMPVIVDPSHGTGLKPIILPLAKAAIACGADGLMIEVHHDPESALSDGDQALTLDDFSTLMIEIQPYLDLAGKSLC
jgi:3-deoxy-7-phosphoheptulonate synthase